MNITEIHVEGGILFMGVLSLLFIAVLSTGISSIVKKQGFMLKLSQELALFALVWGILGQLLGLFGAFSAIETVGEVSQEILAGGLKVSSYPTLYGLIIFLVAKLIKLISIAVNKN
jgi:hypothetical protein